MMPSKVGRFAGRTISCVISLPLDCVELRLRVEMKRYGYPCRLWEKLFQVYKGHFP